MKQVMEMAAVLQPKVDLDKGGWQWFLEKYKMVPVMSEGELTGIWKKLYAVCCPCIWYTIGNAADGQNLAKASRDDCRMVFAAATLGAEVDRLQWSFEKEGKLLWAYTLDCLAMEMLQCLYKELESELARTGNFISEYIFFNPTADNLEDMKRYLIQLAADIHLNKDGMMQPLKSVLFRGVLTAGSKHRRSSICENCSRIDCPQRQISDTRRQMRTAEDCSETDWQLQQRMKPENNNKLESIKYSYGYQRIFGEQ